MSDPITQTKVLIPAAGGGISWLLGQLFDIPPSLVFVVFIGCFIGLVLRDATPEFTSKVDAALHFGKTLLTLVLTTIVTSWVVTYLISAHPDQSDKTIAGLTGFAIVAFQRDIVNGIRAVIKRKFGKAGT